MARTLPNKIAGHQKLKGRTRYGSWWNEGWNDVEIEMEMIRRGGRVMQEGHWFGEGLFYHYKRMWELIWPEEEVDPWAERALHSFCENNITVLIGPKDCAKTQSMAKIALCDWWCFPEDTLWLVSSTTLKDAQRRVWGRIKGLFNRAKRRWPTLPGKPLEYLNAILNDQDNENHTYATELDKGLVLVPCRGGSDFVGLSSFIGVKAKRLRHAGDEVQLMPDGFLNAYSNWTGEQKDFKGLMAGNPTDLLDSLCKAARPSGGWETFNDTRRTMEWDSDFYGAHVVNYDGRDSPNNLHPYPPKRYAHLIGQRDVDSIVRAHRDDSWITFMQAYGKPNRLLASKRVITQLICEQGHAFDLAVWKGGGRTLVAGIDPAYGGGDLCIFILGEFGPDIEDRIILKVYPPEIIPISVVINVEAEDQIADWVRLRSRELNLVPQNIFYGAFGKGTLGYAFSKVFGQTSSVPIDEGGLPTKRAVREGEYIVDDVTKQRRLKRCDEHYDRRISQLWYDTRICIESNQIRELPKDVAEEGYLRTFSMVRGNKVSVETKEKLKERMQGESPNKFDALTIMVAGALLRGFRISKLGVDRALKDEEQNSLEKVRERMHELWKSRTPSYA